MNNRMAEIISLGFLDASVRLNKLLVKPLVDKDGWIEGLSSTSTDLTRLHRMLAMTSQMEVYTYRQPDGSILRLTVQSNGQTCNKFVSDGMNLHCHLVGIEIESCGFITNPLLPLIDDAPILEVHTKILMFMQTLLVRLELKHA